MPPPLLLFGDFDSFGVLFRCSFQGPGSHGHGSTRVADTTALKYNRTSSAQAAVPSALEVSPTVDSFKKKLFWDKPFFPLSTDTMP